MKLKRCKGFAVPLMLLISLLAGCDKSASTNNAPPDQPGYPKQITTALGTAVITHQPQRVVALGAGAEDIVLDLGIVPIGIESHRWGGDEQGYLPWFKQAVQQRGGTLPTVIDMYPELDIEKVINLKPDLIVATQSGLTQEIYDHLSHFAPVIAYPSHPWLTTPQQQIELIARALDKQSQGEKLTTELNATLREASDTIPHINRYTFAYIKAGISSNMLSVYVKGDPRVDTLVHLGLTLLPSVSTLADPFGSFAANIGLENADYLNGADILVTWFNNEQERKAVEAQPLFQSIRAVHQGGYIPLTDQSLVVAMSYGTPLSLRWGLSQFMPILAEAIKSS
ncbi:iron-siderophore ABC transporter substrate-binding protein [Photorhabdus laumondii]|uniref:iron-siderophore ABC transporter substrate-binding protein n=1 Tax=Photorhabdus laumondii TaxID=2218628 RepID=UPI003315A6EB